MNAPVLSRGGTPHRGAGPWRPDMQHAALPAMPPLASEGRGQFLLAAGTVLFHGGQLSSHAWLLERGAMRLDQPDASRERFVQITLAGELLGTDAWLGLAHGCTARALTDCTLRSLPAPDPGLLPVWLGHALRQQARRTAEMVSLRTGSAPERVRRLLLILSASAGQAELDLPGAGTARLSQSDHVLPRLKDIATILDTTPETVSRVLSSLRRARVLLGRDACFARFDPTLLAGISLPAGMTRSLTTGP